MAFGAAIAIIGPEFRLVGFGIALSGVVLGALVALRFKAPLAIATALVGILALFHGYVHGTEMPGQISAFTYGARFVIGTGLLYLAGIVIGFATRLPRGELMVCSCGGVISVIGLTYLVG